MDVAQSVHAAGKDFWEKLSVLTPLIVGFAVTLVGALFTRSYNTRQLQLSQIEALDKLRALLTSDKPEERAFGYTAFATLGYEALAIQIIKLKSDQAGRSVLDHIASTGSPQLKAQATDAIASLDAAAAKVIDRFEFGTDDPAVLKTKFATESAAMDKAREALKPWAQETMNTLCVQSELLYTVLVETAADVGVSLAKTMVEQTNRLAPPPLSTKDGEKRWLSAFLDLKEQREVQSHHAISRTETLRRHLQDDDWELRNPV